MEQKRLARQVSLAKTLSVTVFVTLLCYAPFGVITLVDQETLSPHLKKVSLLWARRLVKRFNFLNYFLCEIHTDTR